MYTLKNATLVATSLLFTVVLFGANSAFALEATHGNGALEIFDNEGIANSPRWVMLWIYFMLAIFACSIFFVWNHPIARWVLLGFISGAVAMAVVSAVFKIPPYSGYIAIFHLLFWSPALYQLLSKKPFLGSKTPFAIWSAVMTAVILFSFIFDIRDAAIFLKQVLVG